jgi:hypothetical protein
MRHFSGGASSSEEKPRYDLVPLEAIDAIARRLTMGAEIHGEHNYKFGEEDFWTDRKNHAVEHLYKYIQGDLTDNHLDGAITNLAMLCWKDKHKTVDKSLDTR